MSIQNNLIEVENFIKAYANALNTADTKSIPDFYAENGQLMPNGFKTLTRTDISKNDNGGYLKKTGFKIKYTSVNSFIDGEYAFVEATASVTTANSPADKVTRDLFVLKNDSQGWKIVRYIFNTSK